MASHARQADRENQYLREEKPATKSVINKRPILGDVGNKINLNQNQIEAKGKEVKAHPLGAVRKATNGAIKKPTNGESKARRRIVETATKPVVTKENSNNDKKAAQNKKISKLTALPSIEEPISYSSKQLVGVIGNIDKSDNPLHVSEYVQDIYKYLLELENKYSIEKDYLQGHKTTPRMRSVLVNWLVDVQQNMETLLETLHLTVAIIDRYLQLNKDVGRDTLQLVGTTAMWLASKYEEMYPSDLTEFVYMCDNAFTKKQFLEMEQEILKKIGFELGRPLSLQFLRRFSRIAEAKAIHHSLGKYLIELALLEYEMCHIKPSLIAAGACCLSITLLNKLADPAQAWSATLVYYSNYKYCDIKSVVTLLAGVLMKVENSKYRAIPTKYSHSIHNKISLNPVLKSLIVSKLASQIPSTNK